MARSHRGPVSRRFLARLVAATMIVGLGLAAAMPPALAARGIGATIPVAIGPFFVVTDPVTNTVYVANTDAGTLSGPATNPLTNTLYVANPADDTVFVITPPRRDRTRPVGR